MNEAIINRYVDEWSEVYKKGQLSFWVLLSLFEEKRYAADVLTFLQEVSDGEFVVKEQSLYRALRRFRAMKLIDSVKEASPSSGSKRHYYFLTPAGREVLKQYTDRNIKPLYKQSIVHLISNLEGNEKNEV